MVGAERVWSALGEVMDPEIPVLSVVDLGVVRAVETDGDRARVALTPTFSGCPALGVMRRDVEAKLRELGYREVTVDTVLAPAWTTDWLTDEAKAKLERYGVAPPGPVPDLLQLEPAPPACPRCGSLDTRTKNAFGPTLCKSLHVCADCREPFEAFKSL